MGVLTDFYQWATDAGVRVEPPTSIKESGAVPNAPMGAGVFNDLLGRITDAVVAIDDAISDGTYLHNIHPGAGGWDVDDQTDDGYTRGDTFGPGGTSGHIVARYNVSGLVRHADTGGVDATYTIDAIRGWFNALDTGGGAGDGSFTLYKSPLDGTSSEVSVSSTGAIDASGPDPVLVEITPDEEMDPAYSYWVELDLEANGGGSAVCSGFQIEIAEAV